MVHNVMLNAYCQNILKAELAKPDYDGKTADAAWSWLMDPTVTTVQQPTNERLTPVLAASVIGPVAANSLAVAVKAALPGIADSLMADGVNLSDPKTGAFLDTLVPAVGQDAINALKALGSQAVTVTIPRRFDRRFDPELWPHVAADGTAGGPDDPAIHGFPNVIERADFDAAWTAAGRN